MVKIIRYFNNVNKFQQFQQQKPEIVDIFTIKFGLTILTMNILGMVMVKIGLTVLTKEPQFWPNGQKSWSSDRPKLIIIRNTEYTMDIRFKLKIEKNN
jgi:hypothetical protein